MTSSNRFRVSFVVVPLLALGALARQGIGCAPAPGPPIPTEYRCENDVVVEIRQDTNFDGKMDLWRFYDRAYLVRFRCDLDHDGTADWQETWQRPADHRVEAGLQQIDGRWRIVPQNHAHSFRMWGPSGRRYPGKAEKLVDGKWTGTFEDTITHVHKQHSGWPPSVKEIRWKVTYKYQDGRPIDAVQDAPGYRFHVEWKDGQPLRT
jgi:hypothetical protein